MNTQDIINELKQSEEHLRAERFRIKGIIKHLEKPNKEEEVFAAIKMSKWKSCLWNIERIGKDNKR